MGVALLRFAGRRRYCSTLLTAEVFWSATDSVIFAGGERSVGDGQQDQGERCESYRKDRRGCAAKKCENVRYDRNWLAVGRGDGRKGRWWVSGGGQRVTRYRIGEPGGQGLVQAAGSGCFFMHANNAFAGKLANNKMPNAVDPWVVYCTVGGDARGETRVESLHRVDEAGLSHAALKAAHDASPPQPHAACSQTDLGWRDGWYCTVPTAGSAATAAGGEQRAAASERGSGAGAACCAITVPSLHRGDRELEIPRSYLHTEEGKPPTALLQHGRSLGTRTSPSPRGPHVKHRRGLAWLVVWLDCPRLSPAPRLQSSERSSSVCSCRLVRRQLRFRVRGVPGRVECLDVHNPFTIPHPTAHAPIVESPMRNHHDYLEGFIVTCSHLRCRYSGGQRGTGREWKGGKYRSNSCSTH